MKAVVVTLALTLMATTLFSGSAQARCWWNGYRTVCDYPSREWRGPRDEWPRYPGWERHRWCYYHPGRCGY